ncbi:MAG: DNA cytosine methyltransferase [Myxococcales bacterium]|nr:DNA cytosine methyltransferase [Myxococcales bacterium]
MISLFCGAGGLDLGFHQAGFQTVLAADKDAASVQTFNLNFKADNAIVLDLARPNMDKVIARLGENRPVGIIGGPPCQGFSRGNVLKNPNDPRNHLPYAFARFVGALLKSHPIDFILFENVAGLASPKQEKRWTRIVGSFKELGFHLFSQIMDAQDFGVAQTRKRLFLIGFHQRLGIEDFKFPSGNVQDRLTVGDVIADLPPPLYFNRALTPTEIPFHPNHWTTTPRSRRFESKEFNKWRSFRKLDWDVPSPTVAYGNREIHIHPAGNRRLSILEAMLLQGFPREFQISGNLSEQVTQVCNAVPPPLAKAIAIAIRERVGYKPLSTASENWD